MRRLRFVDLKANGVVTNRATLGNWQKKYGFPRGQLTGPNSRSWTEAEVQEWLDARPTAAKTTPRSKGRPRKADTSVGA